MAEVKKYALADTPPAGAVCIEDGCTQDATTTRPLRLGWITDDGVAVPEPSNLEWVCATHACHCKYCNG